MSSRSSIPVVVQTAATMPADDGGWATDLMTQALSASRGCGQLVGSAELLFQFGWRAEPSEETMKYPDAPPAVGTLIRLALSEGGEHRPGAQLTPGSPTLTPIWWGYVEHHALDPDADQHQILCHELAGLLTRVYVARGWELSTTDGVVNPGRCPVFNLLPQGDRSFAKVEGSYVHDRGGLGQPWTADQIADMLLRRATREHLDGVADGSIVWTLGTIPAGGTWTPKKLDLHGLHLADCLNLLFNPRQGLLWRTRVAGSTVYIDVLPSGGEGGLVVNLAGSPWIRDAHARVESPGYDQVVVTGQQPLVGITLVWRPDDPTNSQLEPDGWTPGTDDHLVRDADPDQPYLGAAWRKFRLREAWGGLTNDTSHGLDDDTPTPEYSGLGLRTILMADGSRLAPTTAPERAKGAPAPWALDLEQYTPWSEQWGSDKAGSRQGPLVIARWVDGRPWEDLTKTCSVQSYGGPSDPGWSSGIAIGNSVDDAMNLMGSIGPSGELRVTLGVREWAPLTVWWSRPEAQWRTPGMPRIYQRHLHAYSQWIGLRGSTIGLTEAGEPILQTDDQVILNEVPDLIRFRDHVVAWHGTDRLRASWTDCGTIALWSPGELIGPLTIRAGSTFPINAPVMRVLWDFDEYTTTVECIPLAPDLQTLA